MSALRRRRSPGEPPPPPRPESRLPLGECQICGRAQRVRDGVMVLHGYRRPGHGSTQGRCPGVGYPPYDVSVDRLREYVASLAEGRDNLVAAIARADSGALPEIVRYGIVSSRPIVSHPGDPNWPDELRRHRGELAHQLSALDAEARHQRRRVEAWPGPSRGVRGIEASNRADPTTSFERVPPHYDPEPSYGVLDGWSHTRSGYQITTIGGRRYMTLFDLARKIQTPEGPRSLGDVIGRVVEFHVGPGVEQYGGAPGAAIVRVVDMS